MRRVAKYLSVGLIVILCGCGDDVPIDSAWQLFRDKDYVSAHAAFSALTGSTNEAYVGLGWTTLMMSIDSVDASDGYFQAIEADSSLDGYAGWAIVSWSRGDYANGIERAKFVIRHAPSYVFNHDKTITYLDILYHEALCAFNVGDNQLTIDLIIQLDDGFTPPDLNDPNIQSILLQKLEALYDILK
ncbi:hypothetical protein K1X84_12180 [bacterium]|nr:hypothetical protein [bacterium]